MKKVFIIFFVFVISFLSTSTRVFAQDDFPEDPGETDVPFDNGTYILVAGAVLYGIKIIYGSKKEENKNCKNKANEAQVTT